MGSRKGPTSRVQARRVEKIFYPNKHIENVKTHHEYRCIYVHMKRVQGVPAERVSIVAQHRMKKSD